MSLSLTTDQIERYSRQILVPDFGGKGQIRLRQSRVLIVGAGGLGSPTAFYLTAAGVGALGLIDADKVELANLQRQILHATNEIGKAKVESGKKTLTRLNPDVEVITYPVRLGYDNVDGLFSQYDFIVDGSDNFETKFLINDSAVRLEKAYSHAGIVRWQGQTMTVIAGKTACYRCLFKEPPAPAEILSCEQSGIVGAVGGTVGSIQAAEAIKYLIGFEDGLLTDRLLTYDARSMKFHEVKVTKDPECKACSRTVEHAGFGQSEIA